MARWSDVTGAAASRMRTIVGCALVLLVGNRLYIGLGVPLIVASLAGGIGVTSGAFALKLLFTSVSLGAGFQGGQASCGARLAKSILSYHLYMESLKNKTIFVTGASSGIGRATALRLAGHGRAAWRDCRRAAPTVPP